MRHLLALCLCAALTAATTLAATVGADWGLDRIDQPYGLNGTYTYSRSGVGVTVWMLDSGIRASHQELAGRVEHGPTWQGSTADCAGHGTRAAALIGGTTLGAAPGVTFVSVRVSDCAGVAQTVHLLDAIAWVRQAAVARPGPDVVYLPLYACGVPWEYDGLDAAVQASIDDGTLWVLVAGNENRWVFECTPSRVDHALTVGSVDRNDVRAADSNYGPQVDLFAPGVQVLTAGHTADTEQVRWSGTSAAAALVAGAAARFLEAAPWAPPGHTMGNLTYYATPAVINPGPGTQPRLLFTAFMD